MKKETLKELGKLVYDFAKILFALVLITPYLKGDKIAISAIIVILLVVVFGTYIINKGAKDDE